MTRTPLRPLARILNARARGENPDHIERENLRLRMEAARDKARRRSQGRMVLMAVLLLGGFVTIGARMALLAATEPAPLQRGAVEAISSERADIVDRQGRVLATNLSTHALYAETRLMVDPARAAQELGRIFDDVNVAALTRQFSDPNRRFVWVRTRVSPEQRQAVHDIGEPGLMFGARNMRIYPNGTLAAHVLGGASFGEQGVRAAEIIGVGGVEHHFDERLRDPARILEPLRLTIDMTLQAVVTEVLGSGMRMLNAKGASAVLMDAFSGEVLVLVSLPEFDPNLRPPPPTEGDPAQNVLFNRAVQGFYELGSVMKVFTVAQALEEGLITPDTMLNTRSPMQVGRFRITDFRNHGAQLSTIDAMVLSSNVATARLAQRIGPEAQRAFLDRLGLLDPVPIELAETRRARPLLPYRWTELSAMTISYGHGLTTSPLLLAVGNAAIVNGGYMVRPTLEVGQGGLGERVISERTSAQMRYMLYQVVERGTASFARLPGFGVGGKTGTAQKPNAAGGYYENRVISTFASAFPMDNPRYVLVVALDEPEETTGSEPRRTAGWTAVPVTGEIVRRIAPLMGLEPRPTAEIDLAMRNAINAAR